MISSMGSSATTVKKFFEEANKIFMKIILKLLWLVKFAKFLFKNKFMFIRTLKTVLKIFRFSPVGVCSLIAGNLLGDTKLDEMLITLVYYIVRKFTKFIKTFINLVKLYYF